MDKKNLVGKYLIDRNIKTNQFAIVKVINEEYAKIIYDSKNKWGETLMGRKGETVPLDTVLWNIDGKYKHRIIEENEVFPYLI